MIRRAALMIGRSLAKVRLNQVEPGPAGSAVVRKRRRWWSFALLPPGNLLSRLHPVPVRVLGEDEWRTREAALALTLGRELRSEDDSGWLDLPRAPGRVLGRLLADKMTTGDAKLKALRLAASALGELHRLGETHGDATVENIAVDLASERAGWFDFDAVHLPGSAFGLRRADDLRALIFSAAGRASEVAPEELVQAVLSGSDGPEVVAALVALVRRSDLERSLWHQAQSLASPERQRGCVVAIERSLR